MAELLLELLSEEIPARMQARAAEDLRRAIVDALATHGLEFSGARAYVTPRRLTLVVEDLPLAQPDVTEERRGPRVGAPAQALEGFLKSAGVAREQLEERDTGKGVFYFAVVARKGRPTAELLREIIEQTLSGFPWPKSMRWNAHQVRWVRPLHRIVCLFDGQVVPVKFGPVAAGNVSVGHRFTAPAPFEVRDFAQYYGHLRKSGVMLDAGERREYILAEAERLAAAEGLALREDEALLQEVTGLVEWPVVLLGTIDEAFMEVPAEVLITAMRSHQKYFSLLRRDGTLAPRFVVVANRETADGGREVVAGNERVLRARLSDAKFFWDTDRRTRLDQRVARLKERLFYASLGTMFDKAERMKALARHLVFYVPGADVTQAVRAAELAKADLSTEMVGEFPELQGVMGRYYAINDGESEAVANAIAEHYSPQGPGDACPRAPVAVTTALADKLDTLVGFFGINEKPTGSKDPFALRRAALGAIRLIIENGLRLPLLPFLRFAHSQFGNLPRSADDTATDLLDFFADRLKVHLRESGVRHDLISAVFALGGEDDLVRLLARVGALGDFLLTEDGFNLLVAYRRAANIVRIEEKKDGVSHDGPVDADLLAMAEEKALVERLADVRAQVATAIGGENFEEAMAALARLRGPVDEFFDRVTVNVDEPELRANRLRLLSQITAAMGEVADFSRIEG